MRVKSKLTAILCIGAAVAGALLGTAETIELNPVADTGLFQPFPNNNFGAQVDLAVGTSGPNGGVGDFRGLFQFDIANEIPAGATIESVSFRFRVTNAAAGSGSTVEVRRQLTEWTEGTKTGLKGQPATTGETTWNNRQKDVSAWGTNGGQEGTDYAGNPSGFVAIDTASSYTIPSSAEMVADVQAWLDNPDNNFGWLMRSRSEGTPFTARRIATRETSIAANRPVLIVEFSTLPSIPPTITSIEVQNAQATLAWENGNPPYQVQFKPTLADAWSNVGDPTTETSATVPAPGDQGYYQIVSE